MTPLQIALIEKLGGDNGFEYGITASPEAVTLGSARHRARARILLDQRQYLVSFTSPSPALLPELVRQFPRDPAGPFTAKGEADLASLLRRAAALAQALPRQAVDDYATRVATAMRELPATLLGTEVERLVRQRVGQQTFRQAQMDYWGGACAVTGIAVPEVLRASHAKPWADCLSDAERLDVFNGFLLSANLDALFDRFLISFDPYGLILLADALPDREKQRLGLDRPARLRWVAEQHQPYLAYHRARFVGG
jgi:hypothetical protein